MLFVGVGKIQAAKLIIDPPTGTYAVGQQFQSKITLDTEEAATAGVDVLLKYNPAILKITNVQNGEIFSQYISQKIDNDKGSLSLSGIVALDDAKGYTGNGTFATVVFEGIAVGAASVDFDFSPGVRSDSNVAAMSSVDDSLSSASGANYSIIAAQSKGGLTEATPTALPKSGVIEDTLKLVGSGLSLILLSLLFLL
ncbi:hypothetical protein GW940_05490 [Candidatus Microgenomates bacterium]|nr:hypothetical protein [Candidatus Microgenomates bacterium]